MSVLFLSIFAVLSSAVFLETLAVKNEATFIIDSVNEDPTSTWKVILHNKFLQRFVINQTVPSHFLPPKSYYSKGSYLSYLINTRRTCDYVLLFYYFYVLKKYVFIVFISTVQVYTANE